MLGTAAGRQDAAGTEGPGGSVTGRVLRTLDARLARVDHKLTGLLTQRSVLLRERNRLARATGARQVRTTDLRDALVRLLEDHGRPMRLCELVAHALTIVPTPHANLTVRVQQTLVHHRALFERLERGVYRLRPGRPVN